MTSGMMPRNAYFTRISATRASAGIAGKGKPLKSILSISTVRSSPVTVSVEWPASLPGRSVVGDHAVHEHVRRAVDVTTMMTRMIGGSLPPAEQKEGVQRRAVAQRKRQLKAARPIVADRRDRARSVSASITACGTGTGTSGSDHTA